MLLLIQNLSISWYIGYAECKATPFLLRDNRRWGGKMAMCLSIDKIFYLNSPLKPISLFSWHIRTFLYCLFSPHVCECREKSPVEPDHRGWCWVCWPIPPLAPWIWPPCSPTFQTPGATSPFWPPFCQPATGLLCSLMSIESFGNVHWAPQKEIVI